MVEINHSIRTMIDEARAFESAIDDVISCSVELIVAIDDYYLQKVRQQKNWERTETLVSSASMIEVCILIVLLSSVKLDIVASKTDCFLMR